MRWPRPLRYGHGQVRLFQRVRVEQRQRFQGAARGLWVRGYAERRQRFLERARHGGREQELSPEPPGLQRVLKREV